MATAKPSLKVRISFYTNSPLQILPLLTFKGDLLLIARHDKQHIEHQSKRNTVASIPLFFRYIDSHSGLAYF